MWTARPGVDATELTPALEAARDAGCSHLAEIANGVSQDSADARKGRGDSNQRRGFNVQTQVNLSTETCLAYLRDNLHFQLGAREQRGLRLFCEHAVDMKLIPDCPHEEILRFHDCKAS